ncbi:MAG: hypothetical protein A7316_01470 [Candidatus Altiarchaeales archaeon WOR_SM1_86-2]|nr:MAG: hypothetical protein A7316_01470 [Candidatus Altiarchaeales archaeon WOR_SM1_86-2]
MGRDKNKFVFGFMDFNPRFLLLRQPIQEHEKHRRRFKDAEEFTDRYNNRPHGALYPENAETPDEAFTRKPRQEVLWGLY